MFRSGLCKADYGGVLDRGEGDNASNKPACKDCTLNREISLNTLIYAQTEKTMKLGGLCKLPWQAIAHE